MTTYTYELVPVNGTRETINKERIVGSCVASNYGTATQIASAKAAEISKERNKPFGVAKVY